MLTLTKKDARLFSFLLEVVREQSPDTVLRAAVMAEAPLVIVDNTCIEPWEISPYLLFATSFDYQVTIKEVHASLESCVKRNTHGVPYHVIRSMHSRFQTRTLPAHWKVDGVFEEK